MLFWHVSLPNLWLIAAIPKWLIWKVIGNFPNTNFTWFGHIKKPLNQEFYLCIINLASLKNASHLPWPFMSIFSQSNCPNMLTIMHTGYQLSFASKCAIAEQNVCRIHIKTSYTSFFYSAMCFICRSFLKFKSCLIGVQFVSEKNIHFCWQYYEEV